MLATLLHVEVYIYLLIFSVLFLVYGSFWRIFVYINIGIIVTKKYNYAAFNVHCTMYSNNTHIYIERGHLVMMSENSWNARVVARAYCL